MTHDELQTALADIYQAAKECDHEKAHSLEDKLHQCALKFIASGNCKDPVGLASLVLITTGIDFERWCA